MNSIQSAAARLRSGQVSPVELLKEALLSIERTEEPLNAYLLLMAEAAHAQARRAEDELRSGLDRGPLHGIPIALKDVFSTKGVETNCGSRVLAGHIPDHDAAVVERFHEAGAVVVGKTNMHELAYGISSSNPHFGTVHNPWDLDRIPGGSSGGSGATVAAGSVFLAMGSDTGGSIRIPASFCGTVGIKPTSGRVSRYGVLPLDFSLDHMGPLTRTVRDAAIGLEAISGQDPRDDTSSAEPVPAMTPGPNPSLQNVKLGVPENYYNQGIDPEVRQAFDRAVEMAQNLGANLNPVRIPDIDAYNLTARIILLAEASAAMTPFLNRRDEIGDAVLPLLDQGRFLTATQYINAQRLRRLMRKEFGALFRQIDCLLTPTTPIPAPRIGETSILIDEREEDARMASTRFVRAINLLGLPALSMPCGFTASGLPIGLQIIGRAFEEPKVFEVAAALEDAGIHPARVPAL